MAKDEYPHGNMMPGHNNAQKVADSKTWAVTVEDLTRGVFRDHDTMSGPVVGPPYDEDELGETRARVTWRGKK